MKFVRALIFVTFGAFPALAAAQATEIYKCVDSAGRPLYTSDKRDISDKKYKKCALVSREINVVSGQKANTGKPTASRELGRFPRETPAQAATAKGRQREILQKELVTEEGALAKAKQELSEQEQVRSGNEQNYARVEERLRPFKDNIETHEKNIEALRRELSNLR
jgi:septal ring factor EnvC (AmiA/AmiB activator)